MENQKPKLYFAHPKNTYNTAVERKTMEFLKRNPLFYQYDILNPNSPEHQKECKRLKDANEDYMGYFTGLVSNECKALAMLPFGNGAVGAGIAKEAQQALDEEKPVFYINPETFLVHKVTTLEIFTILSVEETRERLKEFDAVQKIEHYPGLDDLTD